MASQVMPKVLTLVLLRYLATGVLYLSDPKALPSPVVAAGGLCRGDPATSSSVLAAVEAVGAAAPGSRAFAMASARVWADEPDTS